MPAKLNLAGQRFGLAENHEAEPVRRERARPRKEADDCHKKGYRPLKV